MSEMTIAGYEPVSRWRFNWVLPALFRPRQAFDRIASADGAVWQTPITILVLATLIRTLVAGGLRAAAAASGQIPLPPGWEYYTPEQQAQFQQAMTATSGPVFTYLLPAVLAVLGVYLGWLLVGWILHLILTMVGGRGSSGQVLNLAAWAALPFAIRETVRLLAMWTQGELLAYPGLSGFAPADNGNLSIYLTSLLSFVDIYLIWHIVLLVAGVRAGENLSRPKRWMAVLLTVVGLTLLRALPALLAAQFSDLTVIRPFF